MNLTTGFDSRLKQTVTYFLAALAVMTILPSSFALNTNLHTTWLWHMHQPIYWPDRAPYNHSGDHYQNAWDTIQLNNGGTTTHPTDTSLPGVFGDNNRIADYQNYPHDAVQGILGLSNAGGQLNYSGALMENIQSLAQAGQYYGGNWNSDNQTAHGWTTSGGKTRLDLTNFTYHHCIAALVSDETLTMDILIHQRQQQIFWGGGATNQLSRGYFPAETCFSEHIIPTLNKLGIAWSVVANNHLTRSCSDFVVPGLGGGGEACDLPNKADQINPAQGAGSYITRGYTSLGCSPTATAPFAFQPHYARYVDPNTGAASTLIVVPADQLLGWADSFNPWADGGSGDLLTPITSRNDTNTPELLLLAHDGDNAWADGNSYWASWADQFANDMAGQGNEPTTIEQYLSDFPVNPTNIVHVEDGGWVYNQGANDFGSPTFVGWNWPPSYSTNTNPHNVVDPSKGVTDKGDVWRTYIATENRVKTAQQITNTIAGLYTNRIDQIRDPGSYSQTANPIELGWHYYLGGLDSGFVYFGCTADECWRPVIAQSNAVRNVDPVIIGHEDMDTTPPTVFLPQRSPWNPGTTNFGVEYSSSVYVPSNSDFWVWTYAYDVSGITNVTLLFRSNGNNHPPTEDQFKTYAGGSNTAAWVSQVMVDRVVGPQNTLLPPKYMADYYYSKVVGLSDTYVDYYVSATDSRGNTYNSPIQHVYVAVNLGGPSVPPVPGGLNATIVATNQINLSWGTSGGATGYIIKRGGAQIATTNATNYADIGLTLGSNYCYTVAATNNVGNSGDSPSVCANLSAPSAPTNLTATASTTLDQIALNWSGISGAAGYLVNRNGSFLGSSASASYTDSGLVVGSNYCYTVDATNNLGISADSSSACATVLPPSTPQGLTATAVATNQINLVWSASSGATTYLIERGGNQIGVTASTNYSDAVLSANTQYCYMVAATNSIGASLFSSPVCATTLLPPPAPPFVINGSVSNYPGYLLCAPGMTLYAAVRGTVLYVATWSPGTNGANDHFIIVANQLSALSPAFPTWSKIGSNAVAGATPFLSGESLGSYVGWQTVNGTSVTASNQAIKAPLNSGQMQGTLDLVQQFGSMPTTLYLCAAAYATTNGGALVAQAPGPVITNINIEASEFLAVPVSAITDNNGDGVFDSLDPSIGFVIQSVLPAGSGGFTVTWPSLPLKTYEVMSCGSPGGTWTNLIQMTATNGQNSLSYTDTSATNLLQRFYKVQTTH